MIKGVITALCLVSLAMLVDNVRKHKDKIKKNLVMISLYIAMVLSLIFMTANAWFDINLFCLSEFVRTWSARVMTANEFVQSVFVQIVFFLTLSTVLHARNLLKYEDRKVSHEKSHSS